MKIFVQLENRYCVKSMSLFNESRNGKRFIYDIGGRNAKVININDALCIFLVIRTKRQVITEWPVIKLEYRCIVYFMLLLWTVCMHMLRYVYVFSVFLVVSTFYSCIMFIMTSVRNVRYHSNCWKQVTIFYLIKKGIEIFFLFKCSCIRKYYN